MDFVKSLLRHTRFGPLGWASDVVTFLSVYVSCVREEPDSVCSVICCSSAPDNPAV
jgi:hypothetical protein